jgi:predicted dehydrogenase
VATFISERPGGTVDVDDAFEAIVEFECGALGTVEASRVCPGRKNSLSFEINGDRGSIAFDLERLNELQVNLASSDGRSLDGFRTVLVTESEHPFLSNWWPPGHVLGWEHSFTNELVHFVNAIATDGSVEPHGATFEDGYRAAEVCDAVLRSARSGGREAVEYRDLISPVTPSVR